MSPWRSFLARCLWREIPIDQRLCVWVYDTYGTVFDKCEVHQLRQGDIFCLCDRDGNPTCPVPGLDSANALAICVEDARKNYEGGRGWSVYAVWDTVDETLKKARSTKENQSWHML
jgi:hypothetical protein